MNTGKVNLVVAGMTCTNCAMTVKKALEKNGAADVQVNYLTGDVSFTEVNDEKIPEVVNAINQLGYHVESSQIAGEKTEHAHTHSAHGSSTLQRRLIISSIFTLPLLLHMFIPWPALHNPVVQFILCLPVMLIGSIQFGKSAFYSLRSGVPNMDVLIILGASAAFIYSTIGMFIDGGANVSQYLFFETAATIITLVLLGNLIEERSVNQTTSAIADLKKLQPETAKRIDDQGNVEEVSVSQLIKGNKLLVNHGDRIPLDGVIFKGETLVNESMLTGESLPVSKTKGDEVTGGTINEGAPIVVEIKRTGSETTLSKIIELVKNAQHQRPAIQKLGDKISAIFVPVVVGISLITFVVAYFIFDVPLNKSLMQSIAVLVISCPCAMGLATPTAVMVGIGRAAKKGILIKGGSTLEQLSSIKTFVFDKTGTLTTGNFKIEKIHTDSEAEVKRILYSLELHSSHPVAKSIVRELSGEKIEPLTWSFIEEDKGVGMNATDTNGDLYSLGSFRMVSHFLNSREHDLYLLKNNQLIARIDLTDEIKPDTAVVIRRLNDMGIKTILLSGDRESITAKVATAVGITEYYSEKTPAEKLHVLDQLMKAGPVAMIGDGVNDAPALSKATVGISISDATDTAISSAQMIILAKHNLGILLPALKIGQLTYSTIRQNLFWAFFYNVIAIPIAAMGYLSPMIAALSMAFSDVVVIGNSIRLKTRRIS